MFLASIITRKQLPHFCPLQHIISGQGTIEGLDVYNVWEK
jgi:hypothetical protein